MEVSSLKTVSFDGKSFIDEMQSDWFHCTPRLDHMSVVGAKTGGFLLILI